MNKEKQLPAIIYPNMFESGRITLRSKHDSLEEVIANIINPMVNLHCCYKHFFPYDDYIAEGLNGYERDSGLPPIHSNDPIQVEPFKSTNGKIEIKGDQ